MFLDYELKLNPVEIDLLIAISHLIINNTNIENKFIAVNLSTISKKSGRSYNTTKKYIKKFKELK